jgi:DNA-binding response OmpR family regulator
MSKGLRIYIVDDERDTNDILASLVQARDHHATQLFEGWLVDPVVRERKPDMILLDLMLPGVDGFTICDQLKRNRETNLIPVIIVTALNDANHRAAGVRVGANGYLTKPFTPDQLFEAIDKAVDWRREHEQRGTAGEINFDVRSEVTYLQQANDMLADLFAHTPLTERQIKDLRQAVMEMGGNAIEWGHRKNADLMLQITYRIDRESVTLVIRDQGPGFNPGKLPHAASDEDPIGHIDVRNELGIRERGFGIMLAHGIVDEVRYNDKGNEVTLVKRFKAAGTAPEPDPPAASQVSLPRTVDLVTTAGHDRPVRQQAIAPRRVESAIAEIVGTYCHDLMNTIHIINRKDDLPDQEVRLRRVVQRAEETVADLHRFVRQFYRVSLHGAEAGEPILDLEAAQVRLSHLLETLASSNPPNSLVRVLGDDEDFSIPSSFFDIVVVPLFTNAVEAIVGSSCGGNITVEIGREGLEGDLVVKVIDDGPGWPVPFADLRENLLRGRSFSTKGPGRGDGLLCLDRVVRKLGGNLILEEGQGRGSLARVVLPAEVHHG